MGSGHSHSHGTGGHAGGQHRWRMALAFVIIGGFFVVELAAALASGSLALLSDAGHMAADVVTLGAALVATRVATRRDSTGRRTYGSYRAEVFASALAVLMMVGVAIYVGFEAVLRWGDDAEPASTTMLVVGALGLAANIAAMALLRGGAGDSLNVKGAYLEVMADAIGSVGVILAGILIAATGAQVWDSLVALAIAAFVLARALFLWREVWAVLGQHAPAGIDPEEVAATLQEVAGVGQVHDLHLWALTSGMNVATAHLVTVDESDTHGVLDRASAVLREQYGIEHATLQVEPAAHTTCQSLSW
ncbi:cation diffusion facilitator family transporter [Luteipulveratus mongoliensis]|uniref:Cation transporter n=1 Tax=Luteipulveratus mongoliensis TaxID=571913 RepID=A0A0K1JFB4_9MICO|nr:cation diffusion facilitator family transporter [Luteipulveratus mongoliensis]AKU15280.1 cation transporter [Luteipulveratus mongoliensis]